MLALSRFTVTTVEQREAHTIRLAHLCCFGHSYLSMIQNCVSAAADDAAAVQNHTIAATAAAAACGIDCLQIGLPLTSHHLALRLRSLYLQWQRGTMVASGEQKGSSGVNLPQG
jgi:hypothetical protein